MQRLVVGLAGQPGINIAQIFVGGRVTRVGSNGHFERTPGLVILPQSGKQDCQVVIGLRQFGIVFSQLGERGNGFRLLARRALDHAFEETHLRVGRLGGQIAVSFAQSLAELACPNELVDVSVIIRVGDTCKTGGRYSQKSEGQKERRAGVIHEAY